jgi:hypothetical protein
MMISESQRRALGSLAASPGGCTLANMLVHGFTNVMLDRLVSDGLAAMETKVVLAGTRRITVVWVALTDVGRRAVM